MIYDNLSNLYKYRDDVKLYAALIALKNYIDEQPYDKTSVARVSQIECNTIPLKEAKLENHHKYIDVHYVIEGVEQIYINYGRHLERLTDYSEEKDFELFALSGGEKCIELHAGDFLVVYPGESHAPKIAVNDESSSLKKVVIKL